MWGLKNLLGCCGKAGLGAAGAWGPGERWGFRMEGAVGWEESGAFKGYFGDRWDTGGACVEGKRKRGVQASCG